MDDAKFWDRIARKYAARTVADPENYAYTTERTRSFLKPTDSVLEIGCGTGTTALKLAPSVANITGTDISPEMIAIAREKSADVTNVHFEVSADVPNMGAFDAVLAHNLLHLMPDMEGQLAHIHDVVAPGGLFISKTVCLSGRGVKWALIGGIIPVMRWFGKAPFLRKISPETLEAAITVAGFEIVESGDYPLPSRYVVARKPG